MPTSPSRNNASRPRSRTSPKAETPEGQARGRGQAPTHGCAGAGVVVPGEAAATVANLFAGLVAEHAPDGNMTAPVLARKLAVQSVRSERAFRHENARTADRVRNAQAQFDEDRRALADHLYSHIGMEPATFARRLRALPEGIDVLVDRLRRLGKIAEGGTAERWAAHHGHLFEVCLGQRPMERPFHRHEILNQAILGNFACALPGDFEGGTDPERSLRAREEMVLLISEEIGWLEAARGWIDHEAIALSRAEAGDRALIDLSDEGILLRRYETAVDRAFFRTLAELRRLARDRATDTDRPDPQVEPGTDELVGFVLDSEDHPACESGGDPGSTSTMTPGADPAADQGAPDWSTPRFQPAPPPPPLFPRPTGPTPGPQVELPRLRLTEILPDATRIVPTEVALGKRLGSFFPTIPSRPEVPPLVPPSVADDPAPR